MSLYANLIHQASLIAQHEGLILEDFGTSTTCVYALIRQANQRYIGVALLPQGEGEFTPLCATSCEEVFDQSLGFRPLHRALGLALANAIARYRLGSEKIPLQKGARTLLPQKLLELTKEGDEIVFVGNLEPVIKKMRQEGRKPLVFCRQKNRLSDEVHSDIFEYEALASSKVAVITGAALIGSTVDAISAISPKESVRILAGFSAGVHPSWLSGSGFTHVASMLLEPSIKESLFRHQWEEIFSYPAYFLPIP